MRVLLAEDDPLLGDGIQAGLQQSGYTVDWVRDGVAAEHALGTGGFDLLVLDLGLPRQDGLTVLRGLRRSGSHLPVLVLTARDTVADRVTGLDSGADDYLVKPFDLDELTARLRAIARRQEGRPSPEVRYGPLLFEPSSRKVTLEGKPVGLTGRELKILETLLSGIGRVMSRERLEEAIYGWDDGVESNAVEVHVHHLRRKLGKDLIRTVRGVGYVIPRETAAP